MFIREVTTRDTRFQLEPGEGSDAVHSTPQYSFAVTQIALDTGLQGTGLVLTMGTGNDLVCSAIEMLAPSLIGADLEELMAGFGAKFREMADDPHLRWLGPHKGVVHLALASITNACFDLWARARREPLWKLLLGLSPEAFVALLDLSYLEDVLDRETALRMLREEEPGRVGRSSVLDRGYPGYDTSVGWYHYDDAQIRENVQRSLDQGFGAFKLKVGGSLDRDLQRAQGLRRLVGPSANIMLDANQQWSLPAAIVACRDLGSINPYWIEEPTHPDDIHAHRQLAQAIAPLSLALGEHVPNRVVFKNYLEAGCVAFLQPDCTRLGGVSEFLTVSLLARKYNVPVVPHVGDMGQIHQHLVLVNHIAMGHPETFLEHIPHLSRYFVHPVQLAAGHYRTPQEPGSSSELL
ncbi:enolase C-terminal domain-like protein [Paracidobacterium acidisoli]|uniref:Mandelate racemase n=1 Tax=Paracidobacterium acidisoli TaxID=2303751 RepID=A0A372ISI5_9BACT|nr:enolase C-terminal domain-like protein [Paracidobacterium acidisoli]MBT9330834.1 mandelate racemase [Paracidobacterium acidisoli]